MNPSHAATSSTLRKRRGQGIVGLLIEAEVSLNTQARQWWWDGTFSSGEEIRTVCSPSYVRLYDHCKMCGGRRELCRWEHFYSFMLRSTVPSVRGRPPGHCLIHASGGRGRGERLRECVGGRWDGKGTEGRGVNLGWARSASPLVKSSLGGPASGPAAVCPPPATKNSTLAAIRSFELK